MFEEIFESAAFWVLCGVGLVSFVVMLMVLKGMGHQDLMPLWVKIIVFILIPVISAAFTGFAEG